MEFTVERDTKVENGYVLNVRDNGFRRSFKFISNHRLFLHGGDVFNIEERPPTEEELDEMVGSIPDCPKSTYREFKKYACR